MENTDIHNLKQQLIGLLNEPLTAQSLSRAVLIAMQVVEKQRRLSGQEKKELVIHLIVGLIDESDVAGPFESMVLDVVPQLCDVLIVADKSGIHLRRSCCF
jgi:hypothetical protein